jgi:hypothetical protein
MIRGQGAGGDGLQVTASEGQRHFRISFNASNAFRCSAGFCGGVILGQLIARLAHPLSLATAQTAFREGEGLWRTL